MKPVSLLAFDRVKVQRVRIDLTLVF